MLCAILHTDCGKPHVAFRLARPKNAAMFEQTHFITKAEHEAIEVDRFKHRIIEQLTAWQALLRDRGIHVDPVTGAVTLQR